MSYFEKTINGRVINPILGYPIYDGYDYGISREYNPHNPYHTNHYSNSDNVYVDYNAIRELQENAIQKYWE